MPIRKLRKLGEKADSKSYGAGTPHDFLEIDGLLEPLENGEEIRVYWEREGPGEYRLNVLDDNLLEEPLVPAD